jgi:hypothetical protein
MSPRNLLQFAKVITYIKGGRTKIKNRNLILGVNWAQKSIPTTPKAIRAIFVELYHFGLISMNISDPIFFSNFCQRF